MFVEHPAEWPHSGREEGLSEAERSLLWALRRTAMLRPLGQARDPAVHALLQRQFGGAGLGLEHLVRCLIVGLARRAVRPLKLRVPCWPELTDDEMRLLFALRSHAQPSTAAALLTPLAGARAGELVPLLGAMAGLLKGN